MSRPALHHVYVAIQRDIVPRSPLQLLSHTMQQQSLEQRSSCRQDRPPVCLHAGHLVQWENTRHGLSQGGFRHVCIFGSKLAAGSLSFDYNVQVTTQNLERVRRIKNRMVRLTTKVETIREVLEKFLDDDSDMKDMNLTAKVCAALVRARCPSQSLEASARASELLTWCRTWTVNVKLLSNSVQQRILQMPGVRCQLPIMLCVRLAHSHICKLPLHQHQPCIPL